METSTEAPANLVGQLPDLQSTSLVLTFEIDENCLLWTAVPKTRKKDRPLYRGAVELGYGNVDGLSAWFNEFLKTIGSENHDIRILISGPELVQRCFVVPEVPRKEQTAVVRSNAKKVFPFDLSHSLFAWRMIDSPEESEDRNKEVFVQALAAKWRDILSRILGDQISNLTLLTSSSSYVEALLKDLITDFASTNSIFVRLKRDVVETGIFYRGQLEFFREVTIEGIAENSTVADLRRSIGADEFAVEDSEEQSEAVLKEIRAVVGDVLDYYFGQFGQRSLESAVICVGSSYAEKLSKHLSQFVSGEICDSNQTSFISEHSKSAGITAEFQDYPTWFASFPLPTRLLPRLNNVPRELKLARRKRVVRRAVWMTSGLLLLMAVLLSSVLGFENGSLQSSIEEKQAYLETAQSDPILEVLAAHEAYIARLKNNVSSFRQDHGVNVRGPLLTLSYHSAPNIRLSFVETTRGSMGELTTKVVGEVVGEPDKQEASYYNYLRSLENDPTVTAIAPISKREFSQLGRRKLQVEFNFTMAGL